jgi:hypothetical protein
VLADAMVRRCYADRVQTNKSGGICGVMLHDVSLTAGNLGLESGCGIIRPVAQRGHAKASTPVRASRHSIQVCGADVSADFGSCVVSGWVNNERARSKVPSRTCDAEHRP